MNPLAMQQPAIGAAQVSHDSPKVHLIGVKHEMAERGENIRRKNNSLSCFTLSPAPSRLRVYARDGGERVNLGNLVRRPAWRPSRRRSPGWPTLATSRPLAATIPSPARRDTRPHGGPRGVCQSGRVVPKLGPTWPPRMGGMVPSRQKSSGEARGNSRYPKQSLFSWSERPKE
jgi:hypothetical protein